MRFTVPLLLGFGIAAAGCSSHLPPKAVHDELVAPYELDSGDRIRVIVHEQADLSNSYTIDQAGFISMPLVGNIPARGITTTAMEQKITAKLRNGFLRNPDVSVEVDRYRPFFAMGEVNAGGQYPYVAGMTVQAGIAIAGGYSPRADRHLIEVTRSIGGVVETARLRPTDPLMPGDTINVRQRMF